MTTARRREEWDGVDLSRQTLAPRGVVPSSPPVSHYPTFCPIEIAREFLATLPGPLGATPAPCAPPRDLGNSVWKVAHSSRQPSTPLTVSTCAQIPFRPDTRTLAEFPLQLHPRAAKTRFAPEARASLISRFLQRGGEGRGGRASGTINEVRPDRRGKKGEEWRTSEKVRDEKLFAILFRRVVCPSPHTVPTFPATSYVENSYENGGTCRKCLTNIRVMEEAFIFVPWRIIGNWSMRQ